MAPIRDVLIVGGGIAAWLTAAMLAKTLGCRDAEAVRVTVLEPKDPPTSPTETGSIPSMRGTLAMLEVDEAQFVRECAATFKQGVHLAHWVREPGLPGTDHCLHPFTNPSQRPGGPELLPYWLRGAAGEGVPLAQAATLQKRVVDAGRAPKRLTDADYLGALNYGYHFDAGRFAVFMAAHAKQLGVQHRIGTVARVALGASGAIAAVHADELGELKADLYVDCTGVEARLIGEALRTPTRSLAHQLFVDRAMALELRYPRADTPIASCTIATAQEAGWTWDIGLHQRRSVGYVYSSRHTDDASAEAVLQAQFGAAVNESSPSLIKLPVGYRETPWHQNCVAVGASAGSIEPLEAANVGLIEAAAHLLSCLLPADGHFSPAARQFNESMRERFARAADFVKLHYCLTQRREHAFWRDNADPSSTSPELRDRLALWRCRAPHRLDFVTDREMYPPSSWQYVLYGLEHPVPPQGNSTAWPRQAEAEREFSTLRHVAQRAIADLPPHRALIEHLCARATARR